MVKKLILALTLLWPSLATAQAWGPDGQQAVTYVATGNNVIGDGTSPSGGTAPGYAYEHGDIPTLYYSGNGSIDTSTNHLALSDFLLGSPEAASYKTIAGGATQAKFRTICGTPNHYNYDDPILHPGVRDSSHLHMFWGNSLTNAFSTYETLRGSGQANCGGGQAGNRTGYWAPAVLKTMGGRTFIVRPKYEVVYYLFDDITDTAGLRLQTRIPRGFAYVIAPDPMAGYVDPQDAEIAAANAAAGSTRYVKIRNGFLGWKCATPNGSGLTAWSPSAGTYQPYLQTADGHPTLDCSTSGEIIAEFNAPSCWDGHNLTSPNGRGHVRQAVTDTVLNKPVCPNHWYKLPTLITTLQFAHQGQADYTSWYFSSDRMPTGTQYRNGESGHIDWFGAWDYGTPAAPGAFMLAMNHCMGVPGTDNANPLGDPAECDSSTIASGKQMVYSGTAPDGVKIGITDVPTAAYRVPPKAPAMFGMTH